MKFAGLFIFKILVALSTSIQGWVNFAILLVFEERVFESRIHAYYYSKFPPGPSKVMVAYSTLLQRPKCNVLICDQIKTLLEYSRYVIPLMAN